MSKHTRGPWKVTPMTGWTHQVLPKAESPDEHLANAHLIAAAPDMLEALDGVEFFIELLLSDCRERDARIAERDGYGENYVSGHTKNVERSLNEVRAAIAKARGESDDETTLDAPTPNRDRGDV